MRSAFLFDFDGVIADSLSIFEVAVEAALNGLGYSFVKNRRDFLELFDANLYDSLCQKGVSENDIKKLFEYTAKNVSFEKIPLYPNIVDVVIEISKLSFTAILSSNKENQIGAVLSANKVIDKFPIILGLNAGRSKTEKIKRVFADFGVNPEKSFYVVDTIGDIKEAKEAGIKTIAVSWGWHSREKLSKFEPAYFVDRPSDLLKIAKEVL